MNFKRDDAVTRQDITVVMITTDRKPSYFAETVWSLQRSEGSNGSFEDGLRLRDSGLLFAPFRDNKHDPARNVARALEWGASQGRPWVLFLEDDLKFCARFIDSVAAWLTRYGPTFEFNPCGVIHLFGSATITADRVSTVGGCFCQGDKNNKTGFAAIPLDNFYGTQAFAVRAEDAASLSEYLATTDDPPGQYDLSIVKWCRDTHPNVTSFIASIPSFVQHVGEVSSIRPGDVCVEFPSWPGEEWSYVQQSIKDDGLAKRVYNDTADKLKRDLRAKDILEIEVCNAQDAKQADSGDTDLSGYLDGLPLEVACDSKDWKGDLSAPVFITSHRVRADDFRSDWLTQLAGEMEEPVKLHRKVWEYAAIAKVYLERVEFNYNIRNPRVLGFGVGRDPLASWFASHGAEVVATDKPADTTAEDWKSTGQHAAGKEQLRRLKSTTDEDWARIGYAALDMNCVGDSISVATEHSRVTIVNNFDLTWSCGSFEHIGGLQSSLDFFVRQMACLRSGGVAVHTTEYSINHNLYDTPGLCLLRRADITRLAARLAEQGDLLLPFDPNGGDETADLYIDRPPYPGNAFGPYHLNLALAGSDGQYVTTSIVLIAVRDGIRLEKERPYSIVLDDLGYTAGRIKTATFIDECVEPLKRPYGPGKRAESVYKNSPSILFLGDAVATTGFAKSTHAVCDYLYSHGWNVRVCGMNYYGQLSPERFRHPYPIHPAFDPVSGPGSPDGATLLPRLIYDHSPDVVVIQQDPWNVSTYLRAIDSVFSTVGRQVPPIVGFLAVDGANQSTAHELNRLAHVATWTQYGADELRKGGYDGPLSIIPLGVDTDTFKPLDREAIRAEFAANFTGKGAANLAEGVDPSTAFIVGYVGRNQLRKRLDLLIQYFAEFASDRANVLLYLYVDKGSEFDIRSLVHYWGLDGKVIVEYSNPARPADDDYMRRLYNLFSVFATCTQGEGWWLPGFEAAACGLPIVAPDYSAIGELFEPCTSAFLAKCSHFVTTAPSGASMHTLGGLASRKVFINMLRITAAACLHGFLEYPDETINFARQFPWSETGRKFDLMLRAVLGLPVVGGAPSPKMQQA